MPNQQSQPELREQIEDALLELFAYDPNCEGCKRTPEKEVLRDAVDQLEAMIIEREKEIGIKIKAVLQAKESDWQLQTDYGKNLVREILESLESELEK